ncbi:MAG: HAD-IIIA family hydrolase [Candidatus Omnitrophica bacterium]|nr:HAD-IIIA family hydrolase [Candidatus Omnitrophota bacterium]
MPDKRAVFLDRDGTINDDVGYFCSLDRFRFIPGAVEALRSLQKEFTLFIVTNQSGVARKIFSEDELITFNRQVEDLLRACGIEITRTYYCPHLRQDRCQCCKPSPFFLREAAKQYDIDLRRSFMIGDHPHDIETAAAAGAGSVYLLTGHGPKHRSQLRVPPDLVAANISEAAEWIISLPVRTQPR